MTNEQRRLLEAIKAQWTEAERLRRAGCPPRQKPYGKPHRLRELPQRSARIGKDVK